MIRATYPEIERHLKACRTFNGNTLCAVGSPDSNGYRVYSYGTEIASVTRNPDTGRLQRWINPERYSKTTSRAQKLCLRLLPGLDICEFDVTVNPNHTTF